METRLVSSSFVHKVLHRYWKFGCIRQRDLETVTLTQLVGHGDLYVKGESYTLTYWAVIFMVILRIIVNFLNIGRVPARHSDVPSACVKYALKGYFRGLLQIPSDTEYRSNTRYI